MRQIGLVVRDVFESQAHDERGDLVMESLGCRPVSFLLKGRGRDNCFTFTENLTAFNNPYASGKARSKVTALSLLSARDDFSSFARLPQTSSFSSYLDLDHIVGEVEATYDYPIFVKPDDGTLGENACSVYNREALTLALKAVFEKSQTAVVQEKIEIDREYRCVYFNQRAYLLFDRLYAERGGPNRRVAGESYDPSTIRISHVEDDDLWGVTAQASQIVSETLGLTYFAADFAKDHNGDLWFIEANTAPLLTNVYTGDAVQQMREMTSDMISYVRDFQ